MAVRALKPRRCLAVDVETHGDGLNESEPDFATQERETERVACAANHIAGKPCLKCLLDQPERKGGARGEKSPAGATHQLPRRLTKQTRQRGSSRAHSQLTSVRADADSCASSPFGDLSVSVTDNFRPTVLQI